MVRCFPVDWGFGYKPASLFESYVLQDSKFTLRFQYVTNIERRGRPPELDPGGIGGLCLNGDSRFVVLQLGDRHPAGMGGPAEMLARCVLHAMNLVDRHT